jgi:hypothetical protein
MASTIAANVCRGITGGFVTNLDLFITEVFEAVPDDCSWLVLEVPGYEPVNVGPRIH